MGEEPFFHAAQKHQRELEAFCGVQAHQLHAVFPFGGLSLTGFKRRMGEKIRELIERIVFVGFALKIAPGADEFLQVFNARDGFFAAFFAVMVYKTAAADGEIYFSGRS